MNYESHRVLGNGVIEVCLVTAGGLFRYTLAPGASLDGQPAEVVADAAAAWTPEIIAAYAASLLPAPTPEQVAEATRIRRQAAYQAEADPLYFKWQRGEATEAEWLAKVAEIKTRYPE
jgi:hypothetical protein